MKRRDFLSLFSATALASLGPIESLASLCGGRFRSPLIGFSFEVPPTWTTWSVEEIKANLAKQVFAESEVDEDDEDIYTPAPLTACSRYREPVPQMNPIALVYADRHESWMGSSPLELAEDYAGYFPSIVKDGDVVQRPQLATWNGISAATTTISYTGETNEGFREGVLDHTAFMFVRDWVVLLLFEESLAGPEKATAEFERIRTSLVFD